MAKSRDLEVLADTAIASLTKGSGKRVLHTIERLDPEDKTSLACLIRKRLSPNAHEKDPMRAIALDLHEELTLLVTDIMVHMAFLWGTLKPEPADDDDREQHKLIERSLRTAQLKLDQHAAIVEGQI